LVKGLKCLECDATIKLPSDVLEGEIITCQDCGASYEVYRNEKGEIDIRPAKVEGEDWGE